MSVDAVEGDITEETPPKKKSITAKGKGKALASATRPEHEPSPIKQEIEEGSEYDA